MSETRIDLPLSPAKPILVIPPQVGWQTFFYKKAKKDKRVALGLSPNGKCLIPLTENEGEHHIRLRDESGRVFTEDSPVQSPLKKSLAHQEIKLSLRLVNLKNRVDEDYKYFKTKGEISCSHYDAARIKIKACIALFKECYSLSTSKAAFIEKYNQKIKEGHFYNPFRLQQFYALEAFDQSAYQKACENIDYQDSLTTDDFEDEKKQGLKRPREEDVMFFVPRNVKRKLMENKDPNKEEEKEKTSKRKLEFSIAIARL